MRQKRNRRAIIYAASPSSVKRSSTAAQVKDCRALAERQGYVILATHSER